LTVPGLLYVGLCSRKIFRIPSRNSRKIDIYNQSSLHHVCTT